MATTIKIGNSYTMLRAQHYFNNLHPDEVHGLGGDCINPKCDYIFTPADIDEMERDGGWFTCPQCGMTYNYLAEERHNKVGLTPMQMGNIGETVVERLGTIPLLGKITWVSPDYNFPIDMIAGDFGVEVKTNHSEAQPRFKLGGGNNPGGTQVTRAGKLKYCETEGLRPALVGARLNFYTDKADIFVRPDSFSDTWIGSAALQHVATVDFTDLNPFKSPEDVPPPNELPEDDDNIPF